MKKYLFGAIIMAGLSFQSCSKDESFSQTELLCRKDWNIEKVYIEEAGAEIDVFDVYHNDCEADDVFSFTLEGKFKRDDHTSSCESTSFLTNGDWLFPEGDESRLWLVNDFDNEKYTIEKLTEDVSILSVDMYYENVIKKVNLKFTH